MNILFFILSLVPITNAYCPSQFQQHPINDGCMANIINNRDFYGHDVIDIEWDRNIFPNDFIWIDLVLEEDAPIVENCFYGYRKVLYSDSQVSILRERISNNGNYRWHILNVNYIPTNYFIHLTASEQLNCINKINEILL